MLLGLTLLSPNERPNFYLGRGPRILSGRLKSFSSLPDPEPRLDPPEDKGWACEACNGDGCEGCEFTGWITPKPEDFEEDRTDE